MRKIALLFLLMSGCVMSDDRDACSRACAPHGMKRLGWLGDCECYSPVSKPQPVPDMAPAVPR